MPTRVDVMITALQAGATFSNPVTPRITQMTTLAQAHLDDCNAQLLILSPADPAYAAVTALQVSLTTFLEDSTGVLAMLQAHTDFLSGVGAGKFPHDALASVVVSIPAPPAMAVLGGLGALGSLGGMTGITPENTLKHLTFPSALGAMSGVAATQSGGNLFVSATAPPPDCGFINAILGTVTGALDSVLDLITQGLADMNDIVHQAYDYLQQLSNFTTQILAQITAELTALVNAVLQNILFNAAGLLGAMSLDPCLGQVLGKVAPGLINLAAP